MADPSPQPPNGRVTGFLNAAQKLTPANALTIFLLALTIVPAFVVYKLVSDPPLLDRVLSGYRELPSSNPQCVVRNAFVRGGAEMWSIATLLAAQGSDRYYFSVVLNRQPNGEVAAYCETLLLLIDSMRDSTVPVPNFPGSNEPLVEPYRNGVPQ